MKRRAAGFDRLASTGSASGASLAELVEANDAPLGGGAVVELVETTAPHRGLRQAGFDKLASTSSASGAPRRWLGG